MTGSFSVRTLKTHNETRDMPIRVLDSIIQNEEQTHQGFSVYNRGNDLKGSLIDATRVKSYIEKQEREKA